MDAEKASCTRALMLGKKCGDQAMELWKQAAVGCTVNKRSMLVGGKQRKTWRWRWSWSPYSSRKLQKEPHRARLKLTHAPYVFG